MLAKYFKKEGVTDYVTGMKTTIIQPLWLLDICVTLLHTVTYRFIKTELQLQKLNVLEYRQKKFDFNSVLETIHHTIKTWTLGGWYLLSHKNERPDMRRRSSRSMQLILNSAGVSSTQSKFCIQLLTLEKVNDSLTTKRDWFQDLFRCPNTWCSSTLDKMLRTVHIIGSPSDSQPLVQNCAGIYWQKNVCVRGPMQFKPMLFKVHLYNTGQATHKQKENLVQSEW